MHVIKSSGDVDGWFDLHLWAVAGVAGCDGVDRPGGGDGEVGGGEDLCAHVVTAKVLGVV